MQHSFIVSRREFLARTVFLSSAAAVLSAAPLSSLAAESFNPPLVVFSKVYQELKLTFDQAAALTAAVGLDGIDCPVRPGGEILPERATDDLPRYQEALRRRHLRLGLITTGIVSASSPHAEAILRTAKQLNIQHYRLGSDRHQDGVPLANQLREVKAQLKELAAMNKALGVCALFQNHSPGARKYFGGDLDEMHELLREFNPEQIGMAFDLGHALIVHGDAWPAHFERLKPYIKVAYVKDVKRPKSWVPFGEGEFSQTDYFARLKQMGYRAPLSLHTEYEWQGEGQPKTYAGLEKALRRDVNAVKQWIKQA